MNSSMSFFIEDEHRSELKEIVERFDSISSGARDFLKLVEVHDNS